MKEIVITPPEKMNLTNPLEFKMVIKSQEEFDTAILLKEQYEETVKQIEAKFKDPKNAAHKAHKSICDMEKEWIKPFADAIKQIKDAGTQYTKMLQAAEQQKKEKERQEAIKNALSLTDELKGQKEEIEKRANILMELGETDLANKMLEDYAGKAEYASNLLHNATQGDNSVSMKKVAPEGAKFRTTYEVEVHDMMELVKAIASGKLSIDLVLPNMPELKKLAEGVKKDGEKVCDGVRVKENSKML